jgi:hypothetical protein
MLAYILRFGQPGAHPQIRSYHLVAAFDPNVQQMSVLMTPGDSSTPDPPNRYFFAGDKDEKTAIEEAAKSLLSLSGDPGVVELSAIDSSVMKGFIAASDKDLARRRG